VPGPDAEDALRRALRDAAGEIALDVSAAEVLRRTRRGSGMRQAIVGLAAIAVLAASSIAIVGYLNLPAPRMSSSSPTATSTSQPSATALATPAAASPTAAVPDPTDWKALLWQLGSPAQLTDTRAIDIQSVIRWGDGFLAVGLDGSSLDSPDGTIWLSEDGLGWSRVDSIDDQLAGYPLDYITGLAGGYAAWGHNSNRMFTSADGRTWSPRDLPAEMTLNYVGDAFIGFTAGVRPGEIVQWDSPDGISWSSHVAPGLFGGPVPNMRQIVPTPFGLFLINMFTADGDLASYRSADEGATWQAFALPNGLAANNVEVGPKAVFVGEPMCHTNRWLACTGTIGWTPPLWRSTDGRNWEFVGIGSFPELGNYDGRFVTDLPTGDQRTGLSGWQNWSVCPEAFAYGASVRISTDGQTWQTLSSYPGSPDLLEDTHFGCFDRIAIGTKGIVGFGASDFQAGQTDRVWFGQAVTEATAPQLTFRPQPTPTPYVNTDLACLGGEGGDPGVICVPADLFAVLPSGAHLIECPPGLGTPALDGWEQVADTIWRLESGQCVGTP
jgi:hypothetical protein